MAKKMLSILLLSCMLFVMFTGCSSKKTSVKDSNEDIGTIVVGTDGAYYPYCYVDEKDGALKGFEVELFKEIGKRANAKVDIQVVKWQGIFGMLDTGKIDTIACQISKTKEREEKYNFSDPYMYTGLRVAVQEGKENTIKTVEDLANKRIACNTGGNSYATLQEAQKKVKFEIVPYDASGMEYDLSIGRVDGLYQSAIATMGVKEKSSLKIAFAECKPLAYEINCYPVRKDDRSGKIAEAINKALKEMREDGTLKELSMKWFHLDLTQEEK